MGTAAYHDELLCAENLHSYCHSRRDGRDGYSYLIINNSPDEPVTVELPKAAECYILTAKTLRSTVMELNGKPLIADEAGNLPDLSAKKYPKGRVELPALSVMFALL
ncbi:MAG: hypothetical protein ACI3XR_02220 [Eubacteriales bacterium]